MTNCVNCSSCKRCSRFFSRKFKEKFSEFLDYFYGSVKVVGVDFDIFVHVTCPSGDVCHCVMSTRKDCVDE